MIIAAMAVKTKNQCQEQHYAVQQVKAIMSSVCVALVKTENACYSHRPPFITVSVFKICSALKEIDEFTAA